MNRLLYINNILYIEKCTLRGKSKIYKIRFHILSSIRRVNPKIKFTHTFYFPFSLFNYPLQALNLSDYS